MFKEYVVKLNEVLLFLNENEHQSYNIKQNETNFQVKYLCYFL